MRREAAAAAASALRGCCLLALALQLLQMSELLQHRGPLRVQLLDCRGLRGLAVGQQCSTGVEVGLEGSVPIDLVERSHRDEPGVRVRTHLRVQVAAEEKWQISAARVDVAADHGLLHCRTQPRQLGLRRLLVGLDRDDVVLDLGQLGVRLRELLGRRVRALLRVRDVVCCGRTHRQPGERPDQGAGEEEPGGSTARDGRQG